MLLTRQYKIEYKGFNAMRVLMPAFRTENRGMKKKQREKERDNKLKEYVKVLDIQMISIY